MSSDGKGLVSQAGAVLLWETMRVTGLGRGLSDGLAGGGRRGQSTIRRRSRAARASARQRVWEPKRLRLRLFSAAGRLVRGGRRLRLRLAERWPWADEVTAAVTRLQALPSG